MAYHIFIDESIRDAYLVCAVIVQSTELAAMRREMRGLCLPGQRRLHMKSEREQRRRFIVDGIVKLAPRVEIYRCVGQSQIAARMGCLRQLVFDHGDSMHRLVLEAAETMDARDRIVVGETLKEIGQRDAVSFEHLRGFEEPLLWVPDAVAWARSTQVLNGGGVSSR